MRFYFFLSGFFFITLSVLARPLSIAKTATITSSSELNKHLSCSHISDGIIAVEGLGNWMAKGKEAWVMLSWTEAQLIDKVVVYNFPSENSRVLSGQLEFSDGSTIEIELPGDGTAKAIRFEEKKQTLFASLSTNILEHMPAFQKLKYFLPPINTVKKLIGLILILKLTEDVFFCLPPAHGHTV